MSEVRTPLDKWTRWWLATSVVSGAGLVLAAFTLPAYSGSTSQTVVQVNGGRIAPIIAVPLLCALAAIVSIVLRRHSGRTGVGIITWAIIGVLGVFVFLGMASIGVFVAPVPVCLLVAALRIQKAAKG